MSDDAHRCRALLGIRRGHPPGPGLVGVCHASGHRPDVRFGLIHQSLEDLYSTLLQDVLGCLEDANIVYIIYNNMYIYI